MVRPLVIAPVTAAPDAAVRATPYRDLATFLGYTFGPHRYKPDGHLYLGASPSKKSRQRTKQILRGWSAYFSYGSRATAYREVNNYVSDRVRHFLKRRHKVQSRGTERYGKRVFGELGVMRLGPPPRIA